MEPHALIKGRHDAWHGRIPLPAPGARRAIRDCDVVLPPGPPPAPFASGATRRPHRGAQA
jgi:hypothetical protein